MFTEMVLMSTHNLCFEKNKKNRYTPAYIKVRFKGVYTAWTCFPDACSIMSH